MWFNADYPASSAETATALHAAIQLDILAEMTDII